MPEAPGTGRGPDADAANADDADDAARRLLRVRREAARRRRPSWRERLTGWYLGLLTVAVVGAMAVAALLHVGAGVTCTAPAPCLTPSARPLLAAGLAVLALGALLLAGRRLGPVSASPGEVTWLLSSPAARGRLLRPALLRVLLVGAVPGAAAGTVVALVGAGPTGPGGAPAAAASVLAVAAAAGAAVAVAALSALVLRQAAAPGPRARSGRDQQHLGRSVVAVGAAACAVAVLLPGALPATGLSAATAALPLLGPGLLAAAALAVAAVRALDRLPVTALTAGASARHDVSGAWRRLDTDALLLDGGNPTTSRRPSRLARTGGVWSALVVVGALGATARPERLLDALVWLVLPLVVASLLGPSVGAAAATAAALVLGSRLAGPLRRTTRSTALTRALPPDGRAARAALLVAPTALLGLWALLAVPVLGQPWWAAPVVALAAAAGTVRAASPAPGLAGAVVMTEAGPMALGTVGDPLRGADAAALAVLPLLLGAPAWAVLAAPAALLVLLLRTGPR
ncbi:DUF6297 family protein [Jannaschia sp. R86511]|uniref:DUF6297 family protein n=1 Tax=Jannaschia sp. R86511 TaxID=3093853 RepID=UPI0036D26F1B